MLSDRKPKACGGPVMRRTDESVLEHSVPSVSRSGDNYIPTSPMVITVVSKTPDSDPRWGKTPCDPDWPVQSDVSDSE